MACVLHFSESPAKQLGVALVEVDLEPVQPSSGSKIERWINLDQNILSGLGVKEPGATEGAGKASFNSHIRQAEDQAIQTQDQSGY